MKLRSEKLNNNRYFKYALGASAMLHILFLLSAYSLGYFQKSEILSEPESTLRIVSVGIQDSSKRQFITGDTKVVGSKASASKKISLNDLSAVSKKGPSVKAVAQTRPGTRPNIESVNGGAVLFNKNEMKRMVQETYAGQTSSLIKGDKISLSYDVPNGKDLGELNKSELRLYGFFKRGAQKYSNSVVTELNNFNNRHPHLNFPLTEEKQTLTGRLTYDGQGNLKQIKMVRWTNIDKLQTFFEDVLKRMDHMQNPPKELWEENGEFVVFVTLQIN